jgi:hypothetical protein
MLDWIDSLPTDIFLFIVLSAIFITLMAEYTFKDWK